MGNNREVKTVGLGFAEALTILFIALKLTKQISWSCVWVLSPIWISASVLAVFGIAIVLIGRWIERR